jgi:hypothetical protein
MLKSIVVSLGALCSFATAKQKTRPKPCFRC